MKPRSILLVSNYYPPEQGAAPNRIQVLARSLEKSGYTVEVVCPLPNYPTGKVFSQFKGRFYTKSIEAGITVHRLWLWPSKSANKFVRLLSMLSFAKSLALFFMLKRMPTFVFVQYSPVFVGFTSVFCSWVMHKKIILNVSDLWPLAGLEMGLLKKGIYYSLLEKMEQFCYKKAHLILGQSEEILQHIRLREVEKTLFLYRNFPNFKSPKIEPKPTKLPIKIVYAGLLGVAQGLSEILKNITIPEHVEFHVYGDGPDVETISKNKNPRIVYHGAIARTELHQALAAYDLAFIPLMNRIYGSVPSKIFEYTRLGLPLVYMAGGEGGDLVKKHRLGWVLAVQDLEGLQGFLNTLNTAKLQEFPKETIQHTAVTIFDFDKQFEGFKKQLEKL